MKKTTKHSLHSGSVLAAGLRHGARLTLRGASLLACTLLAVSCAKEPVDEGTDGRPVEITPRIGLPASVSAQGTPTRSVADPLQKMDMWFVRSDESAADIWGPYGTTALRVSRTGGTGEQSLSFAPVQYYLTDGLKTRMVGWYPGRATVAGGLNGFYDASAETVNWTIDGSQDILLAAPRRGSKTEAMPVFEFEHALAQLQFCFYAENEVAQAQWGKILGVAVCRQRTAATFALATASDDNLKVTFSGESSASLAAANFAELTAPVGTKNDAAAGGDPVMIEPQEAPCQLTVEVVTEKQGVQTATVSQRAYTKGEAVKICILLAEYSVKIAPEGCEITPWSSVTQTGDNEIGIENMKEYPYILDGHTIVLKDLSGQADPAKYPTHEAWTKTPVHSELDWDTKVSGMNTLGEQFTVAKADAVGRDGSAVQMTWYEASGTTDATSNPNGYYACGEYSEASDQSDKGQWRLPTIRELMLIYDKKGELTSANLPFSSTYWSATELIASNNFAQSVSSGLGGASNKNKTSDNYVRCVRDL